MRRSVGIGGMLGVNSGDGMAEWCVVWEKAVLCLLGRGWLLGYGGRSVVLLGDD